MTDSHAQANGPTVSTSPVAEPHARAIDLGEPNDPATGRDERRTSLLGSSSAPPPNHVESGGRILMKVRDLRYSYGAKPALSGVNLEIRAGRLRGLLGPNGGGKTTLFKCCLGLLKTPESAVELDGRPLRDYGVKKLASKVAYMPQERPPAFSFSVREMVEMGRTPHRGWAPISRKKDRAAVDLALARTGLGSLERTDFNELSGGQRQMVLLARALAQEADLLFLDEPTSSLDFSNQLLIWETARSLAAEGPGVLVCCHDPNHVLWFCDQATVIKNGEVVADGPTDRILDAALLESVYERKIGARRFEGRTFIFPP